MTKTKIISVRLPAELVDEVNRYASTHPYLTRTSIIGKCIVAVMKCASPGGRYKILDTYDPFGEGIIISVIN